MINIEDDVKILKKFNSLKVNSPFRFVEISYPRLQKAISNILSDYTRQKQINEEHKRINGELREKVKELEEENAMLRKSNNIAENVNIDDVTKVINKSYEEFMSNYISTQVVKDKIEELMIQGNYKTFYNPNGRTHFLKEESDCKIEVLQELLEGEKNNENIKS